MVTEFQVPKLDSADKTYDSIKIRVGSEAMRPSGPRMIHGDLFIATDTGKLYIWTGSTTGAATKWKDAGSVAAGGA